MIKCGFSAVLSAVVLCCCASGYAAGQGTEPPAEYAVWLENLKEEMLEKGISRETIDEAFARNYYHPEHAVVKKDRRQAEFVMTSADYVNRLVSEAKVAAGREKYKTLSSGYKKIEEKYGVPFNFIVAFWGMETNYGQTFGDHEVVEALTVLSYDRRRSDFFRGELYQALKIIDEGNVSVENMEGSWAGAMGHFQFMPSTYNAYAVDIDNDGKKDIWNNFDEAAASAANYLSQMGWKKDENWGTEVVLPWNFDYAAAGRQTTKTLGEWHRLGLRLLNGRRIPGKKTAKASLIVPDGHNGHAYLVFDNFRIIMNWNRSENYALAVGMLADYVKTGKKRRPLIVPARLHVKTEDVAFLQEFANERGLADLSVDGQLGSRTRQVVKKLQKMAHLTPDGYPDRQLLRKLKNYNPSKGFAVPVPAAKPVLKKMQKHSQE